MLRALISILLLCIAAPAFSQGFPPPIPAGPSPVPNSVLQSAARDMIRKVFEKEFGKTTLADRQALARLLLAQARETRDDPAARFVALADAMELAAGAGDSPTAVAAADELARQYAVDDLELRRAALLRAATIATSAENEPLMRLALETADQAASVDNFEMAEQLTNLAEGSANKTRQVRLVASIQVHLSELRDLIAEFARVKLAFARLEKEPGDPESHLIVGRFYALHKGQWPLGLPHLAMGNDPALADLAARELGKPADGLMQTALGDAWWTYAENADGITRGTVMAHAVEWYKTAQKSIQGITLSRIASRIGSQAAATASSGTPSHAAGHIDISSLITISKDAAQGNWTRASAGLLCDSSPYACLQLPYMPAEEYDLTVSFTRQEGSGAIVLLLAAPKRSFGFALDVKGEARFEQVAGKVAKDNPTLVPVAISNGRAYTLTVEVRKDQVRALLDGKILSQWKTDLKDLTRYSVWKLGDNALCGIGANNARVLFQSIEMTDITGKGKPTR